MKFLVLTYMEFLPESVSLVVFVHFYPESLLGIASIVLQSLKQSYLSRVHFACTENNSNYFRDYNNNNLSTFFPFFCNQFFTPSNAVNVSGDSKNLIFGPPSIFGPTDNILNIRYGKYLMLNLLLIIKAINKAKMISK